MKSRLYLALSVSLLPLSLSPAFAMEDDSYEAFNMLVKSAVESKESSEQRKRSLEEPSSATNQTKKKVKLDSANEKEDTSSSSKGFQPTDDFLNELETFKVSLERISDNTTNEKFLTNRFKVIINDNEGNTQEIFLAKLLFIQPIELKTLFEKLMEKCREINPHYFMTSIINVLGQDATKSRNNINILHLLIFKKYSIEDVQGIISPAFTNVFNEIAGRERNTNKLFSDQLKTNIGNILIESLSKCGTPIKDPFANSDIWGEKVARKPLSKNKKTEKESPAQNNINVSVNISNKSSKQTVEVEVPQSPLFIPEGIPVTPSQPDFDPPINPNLNPSPQNPIQNNATLSRQEQQKRDDMFWEHVSRQEQQKRDDMFWEHVLTTFDPQAAGIYKLVRTSPAQVFNHIQFLQYANWNHRQLILQACSRNMSTSEQGTFCKALNEKGIIYTPLVKMSVGSSYTTCQITDLFQKTQSPEVNNILNSIKTNRYSIFNFLDVIKTLDEPIQGLLVGMCVRGMLPTEQQVFMKYLKEKWKPKDNKSIPAVPFPDDFFWMQTYKFFQQQLKNSSTPQEKTPEEKLSNASQLVADYSTESETRQTFYKNLNLNPSQEKSLPPSFAFLNEKEIDEWKSQPETKKALESINANPDEITNLLRTLRGSIRTTFINILKTLEPSLRTPFYLDFKQQPLNTRGECLIKWNKKIMEKNMKQLGDIQMKLSRPQEKSLMEKPANDFSGKVPSTMVAPERNIETFTTVSKNLPKFQTNPVLSKQIVQSTNPIENQPKLLPPPFSKLQQFVSDPGNSRLNSFLGEFYSPPEELSRKTVYDNLLKKRLQETAKNFNDEFKKLQQEESAVRPEQEKSAIQNPGKPTVLDFTDDKGS